jgi:dTDP-4-amino-4,6-dideoxygalactose transaminase
MRPAPFSLTMFPVLWAASWMGARPDVYLWEKIRPLTPQPAGYHARYSNVQAAIGLAGLEELDAWTASTRAHAARLGRSLGGIPGLALPPQPSDRVHVYYQYPVYVPDREAVVRRCLRSGVDVEYHHMDVCADLPLFGDARVAAPGARRTTDAVQLPIHAGLSDAQLDRVARAVRGSLATRAAELTPASHAARG